MSSHRENYLCFSCCYYYYYFPFFIVVRILVTSTKFNVRIPNYDNDFYNLLHAELVKDLKPGRVEIGDTLEFYNPTSICGTWFDQNTEYLVTGKYQWSRVIPARGREI